MRLRNISNSKEIISKSLYNFSPTQLQTNTKNLLELEIGMGKGDFLISKAILNPDIFFIGIEKYPSVQLSALKKLNDMNYINNLKLLTIDATEIPTFFVSNSISRIYLNFSDPWPKLKHAKRRLTSQKYFSIFEKILFKSGIIEIKTDQKSLYNFTLEQLDFFPNLKVLETSLDLHNFKSNQILTEYEKRFILENHQIFYIKVVKVY